MSPVPAPLPEPARARILDAALAEFVARGFDGASTNTIARAAGVAKGLVFHHFGSKADLFLAVHERVTTRIGAQVMSNMPERADLFEWLHELALRKMRALQRDPLAYQFVLSAREAPAPLREQIEQRMLAVRAQTWERILGAIDASRLRPGVTLEQAIETLTILGEGLDRRCTPRIAALRDRGFEQFEALFAEVWGHYERLRDGLYAPPPAARKPSPRPRTRPRTRSRSRRRRS